MSDTQNTFSANWIREEQKYVITIPEGIKFVVPFPPAGKLIWRKKIQEKAFMVEKGEIVEYFPFSSQGELTWQLEILDQGLKAIAKVNHFKPGSYALMQELPITPVWRLEEVAYWQDIASEGVFWDQKKLLADLQGAGIVYGIRPTIWEDIQAVNGQGIVVIAEGTPPVAPSPPQLTNLISQEEATYDDSERVDHFASRLKLVQEGQVLARKILGNPGNPGRTVHGQEIPPPQVVDFQFRLKKNVKLSDDGTEVIATVAGLPIQYDEYSFGVEPALMHNEDVDLSVGSIEFPGDVFIAGDVHDGLHVYSDGKVEIQGSVSKAEIRAEKGLKIHRNAIGSRIIVGSHYVIRAKLNLDLQKLYDDLTACLMLTEDFMHSANARHLKPGQCLKLIIERRFPHLPKQAAELEKLVLETKDELIQKDLVVAIRTAKKLLWGLGPLEPQALPLLTRLNGAFAQFLEILSLEVPEQLDCQVDYVQGSVIECAGNFTCYKGTYNSLIQASGDLVIEGVCRGGRIISGGNVEIKELGGSGVSLTTVQFPGTKRLKVGYCHANVQIIVDKEIITLDEPYRFMEVYRQDGRVEMDRLKG